MNGWTLEEPGDEPSPFLLSPQPVVGSAGFAPPPSFEEELEELPDTYGTQALYLTPCDPGRVFAYWDIDWSVFHPGESVRLRIAGADGGVETETLLTLKDSGPFADVRVPVQLWRADDDHILPAPFYADAVRAALPGKPEFQTVPAAGHFDFLAPCSNPSFMPQICKSAPGFDRAAFHASFDVAVARFFLKNLDSRRPGGCSVLESCRQGPKADSTPDYIK